MGFAATHIMSAEMFELQEKAQLARRNSMDKKGTNTKNYTIIV